MEEYFTKITGNAKKLCVSGIIIAMYISIMFLTQSFAFFTWQIRIATCLYSLSYLFPYLIFPLGISNFLSNFLFGGLGLIDAIGGMLIGVITSGGVFIIRKLHLPAILIIPVIILSPGLIVPIWLSPLIGVPYPALAISLCIGQTLPAIAGYVLIKLFLRLGFDGQTGKKL